MVKTNPAENKGPPGRRETRGRRFVKWLVAVFGLLCLVALMLRLPPVQRWVLHQVTANQPGLRLKAEKVSAGLFGVELGGVEVDYRGARISALRVVGRYSLLGSLWHRRIALRSLEAKEMVVDLRELEPKSGPDGPGPLFRGLRPIARLPLPFVAGRVQAGGRLMFPGVVPGAHLELEIELVATNFAPGSQGGVSLKSDLMRVTSDGQHPLLRAEGNLAGLQDAEGAFSELVFRGTVRPARGIAEDAGGLEAVCRADLTKPEERYELELAHLSDGNRISVLRADLAFAPNASTVSGSWDVNVTDAEPHPLIPGIGLPRCSVEGGGTVRVSFEPFSVSASLALSGQGSNWTALDPALARVPPLSISLQSSLTYADSAITADAVDLVVTESGGAKLVELATDQSCRFDLKSRKLLPAAFGQPCVRLRLTELPLGWVPDVFPDMNIRGGRIGGACVVTFLTEDEIHVEAREPFVGHGIELTAAGFELPELSLELTPTASVSSEQLVAALKDCRLRLATGQEADFNGTFRLPRDEQRKATLEGELGVRVPEVNAQVPGLDRIHFDGRFELLLDTLDLQLRDASFALNRADGVALTDGQFSTREPILLDLKSFEFDLSLFEPAEFAWRLNGLPLSGLSRFLPNQRIESGSLYGEFHMAGSEGSTIVIDAKAPFEIRDFSLSAHEHRLFDGGAMTLDPSILISPDQVVVNLEDIHIHDAQGDRLDAVYELKIERGEQSLISVLADIELALPSLTDRVGNLGPMRLRLRGGYDPAEHSLAIGESAFAVSDSRGREFISGQSRQPFQVRLDPFEVKPLGDSSELFQAKFTGLKWQEVFPKMGPLRMLGNLPDGNFTISAEDGGFMVSTPAPLIFGPISAYWHGSPVLTNLTLSLSWDGGYTHTGPHLNRFSLKIEDLEEELAEVAITRRVDSDDGVSGSAYETNVKLHVARCLGQPFGQGLPQYRSGRLSLRTTEGDSGPGSGLAVLEVSDLVSKRDEKELPDLKVEMRSLPGTAGSSRMIMPITLVGEGRTSDLRIEATLQTNLQQWTVAVVSEELFLDDVRRFLTHVLPRGEPDSPEEPPAGPDRPRTALEQLRETPDARPFWRSASSETGATGVGSIEAKSIRFDRYEVRDLEGSVSLSPERLALEELAAEFLGARIDAGFAIQFDGTGEVPYDLRARYGISDFQLGRMFTAVSDEEDPPIEGVFDVEGSLNSRGINLLGLYENGQVSVEVNGRDGHFRGLQDKRARKLSRLTGLAGLLTFSKTIRAISRVVRTLGDLEISDLRLKMSRRSGTRFEIERFSVQAAEIALEGRGKIDLADGKALLHSDIEAEVRLATKGDMSVLFRGVKLIEERPNEEGYHPVSRSFVIGGTLADPDASSLYEMLDEAVKNSRGFFGFGLRRMQKSLNRSEDRQP